MDASEQTAKYPTSVDGRSGATRTPRRDGLDAQPPLCPIPGIEGQRQRQRTGQTQTKRSLPGSTSSSPSQLQASSEGPARRRPNLKPNEERATPTLIEIKCQKCQAYNWTSREVCRSCETPLARLPGVSSSSNQPLQPVARPPGTVPGKSYADAAAGSPPMSQSVLTLDKEGLSKRQAELETVIGTLPDESPLKTELSTQLDSVKDKLKDPRQPGARLDSATAGVKKATARREKAEETLKQAQEALEQARLQETGHPGTRGCQSCGRSSSTSGNPPPGSVSLSSDDVAGLISFFQEACGRKGGRARRRASLQEGQSRTLRGNAEPEGGQRRGCARKIGKGSGIFGFHAESEFEVWGWVLPGSHPRNSPPERLWQRQRLRSRKRSRRTQRPASPSPHCGEGEEKPPSPPSTTKTATCRMHRPGRHPPPQRLWGSPLALLSCMFDCPDLLGCHLLCGLSDSAVRSWWLRHPVRQR